MDQADDPFVRYLSGIGDQKVHYCPGQADVDEAIAGAALADLCRRISVDCLWHRDAPEIAGGIVVLGPGFVIPPQQDRHETPFQRLLETNKVVLAPRSAFPQEEIPDLVADDVTIFCREARSVERLRLSGVPSERIHLCLDLAVHLDPSSLGLPGTGGGEGRLWIGSAARDRDGNDDVVDLRFGRAPQRWASRDDCRALVQGYAGIIRPYAEVATGSPGLAILAATLGKHVVLFRGQGDVNAAVFDHSIRPLFEAAVLADAEGRGRPTGRAESSVAKDDDADGSIDHIRLRLREARRDLEILRNDNDLLFASRLSQHLSRTARRATNVMVAEAGSAGQRPRLVPAIALERARQDFETRLAQTEANQRTEILRLTELAAVHSAQAAAADSLARAAKESEAAERQTLVARLASLDKALAIQSQQVLDLQTSLDEQIMLNQVAETRSHHMRSLIDRHLAAFEAADKEAKEARRLAQGILGSRTWKMARPFRVIGRAFRKVGIFARGAR